MRIKKIPIILTILFFGSMVILNLTAKTIHQQTIPNVVVTRLKEVEMAYDGDDSLEGYQGIMGQRAVVIPKEIYDKGEVFIIESREKYAQERTFARLIELTIGREMDGNYEVKHMPLIQTMQFIVDSNKEIKDGDEVYIIP